MNSKLVLFLLLLFFVSCGNSEISETLSRAELVMDEQPDSALAMLKQIDCTQIQSEKYNAQYALLYSQALDKNYIDVTNDSLINIAVNYYQNHGSSRSRFLSLFYQGRVYYNAKNYAKSMIAYTQAEQLYDEFDDDYYKGMLQTHKGAIYDRYIDYKKGLDAYKKAYFYYDRAKKYSHKLYAKYYIATGYASIMAYEFSDKTYRETMELAKQQKDTLLIKLCLTGLITQNVGEDKYDEATKWLNELRNDYGDNGLFSRTYSCFSVINAYNGDFKGSDKYLELAKRTAKNASDSITLFLKSSESTYLKGEYRKAYDLLEKGVIMEVPNMRKRLEQPILSEQIKVIEKDLEFLKYKQKANVYYALFIGVIVVLVIVLIIIRYRYVVKRKQGEIDDYASLVIDLQQAINNKELAASETIQSILQSHNYLLNNIGDSLSLLNGDAKLQKVAIKEMKNIIVKFSKDEKTLQELEDTVNRCCNNVMSIVRAEVPNLGEEDFRQLCYHFAGFSGKLISILLNIGLTNVYTRKSRLKEKIMLSDAEHKDLIIGYLSESPYLH